MSAPHQLEAEIVSACGLGTAREISAFLVDVAQRHAQDEHARQVYEWALELDPRNVAVLTSVGICLLKAKEWSMAFDILGEACIIEESSTACLNMAVAAEHLGETEIAIRYCARSLELMPSPTAHQEMFSIFEQMGEPESARARLDSGLRNFPHDHNLLFARATVNLKSGNYETGWLDYEHRPTKIQLNAAMDEFEEWDGSPLAGKTILVCREQGCGDEVMFSRYLPLLRFAGGKIVVYTYPELARLFAASFSGMRFVTCDIDVPAFDCWVAMGSLPLKFWPESVLPASRYLNDCSGLRSMPLPPMQTAENNLRVGICWRGNPAHARDEYRSIPFEAFRPLIDVPGCDFYSLQYENEDSGLPRLRDYCHDLADFAAAIAHLDLVISCDSLPLHIAGATGRPAWGLIGQPSDFRWGLESETSIWYPSIKLFRSDRPKEWRSTIEAVGKLMREVVRDR